MTKEQGTEFTRAELEAGSQMYAAIAGVGTEMVLFTMTAGAGEVELSAIGMRCIRLIVDHMVAHGAPIARAVLDELARLSDLAEASMQAEAVRTLQRITVKVPNNGRVQ